MDIQQIYSACKNLKIYIPLEGNKFKSEYLLLHFIFISNHGYSHEHFKCTHDGLWKSLPRGELLEKEDERTC